MSDPNSASSGMSTGGNTGAAVTLEQLASIVAALAGSVQTLVSQSGATQAFQTQIADGLKSLTEQVNKDAVSENSDTAFVLRNNSVIDSGDDQHRMMAARDKIEVAAFSNLTNMVSHANAMFGEYLKYTAGRWTAELEHADDNHARRMDHFSALPPIAPKGC